VLTRRDFLKLLLKGCLATAAFVSYPLAEAAAAPRVTKYDLTPPNWTDGLKLKIVALADIHACRPWMGVDRIRAVCAQANALQGDIILLLGDFATGMPLITDLVRADDWALALSRLQAPMGVHAILGNHDYWHDEAYQRDHSVPTESETALRKVGIPVYINQSVRLEKDGYPFWLCGLGDQLATKVGIDDLPLALTDVTDASPILLMAHEPDIFPEVPQRVSLTLCGHTHGGQINIFGWRPVVPSRYGSRYAGGHVIESERHMIISRGLGCTGLPLRMGVWPEIIEINLG
jgi:predicted MPP superfamily phosphohydrolase